MNPGGRPKKVSLDKTVEKMLNKRADLKAVEKFIGPKAWAVVKEHLPTNPKWVDVVAANRIAQALKSEQASDSLFNRVDGKVAQRVEQEVRHSVQVRLPDGIVKGALPENAFEVAVIDVESTEIGMLGEDSRSDD